MKVLIVSDIHANIHAIEAVWKKENDADLVLCTGDLVEFGFYPKEVIQWARENNIICTVGNHDPNVVAEWKHDKLFQKIPRSKWGWIQQNASVLDENDIDYLANLPMKITTESDGVHIGMTHCYGGYFDYLRIKSEKEYLDFANFFDGKNLDLLIVGHTHNQEGEIFGNRRWINPGAISYKHGLNDTRAHYATMIDGEISFCQLEYEKSNIFGTVGSFLGKEQYYEPKN